MVRRFFYCLRGRRFLKVKIGGRLFRELTLIPSFISSLTAKRVCPQWEALTSSVSLSSGESFNCLKRGGVVKEQSVFVVREAFLVKTKACSQ